jgi:hypothetical protein
MVFNPAGLAVAITSAFILTVNTTVNGLDEELPSPFSAESYEICGQGNNRNITFAIDLSAAR